MCLQLVLVVGASHLRSLADRVVPMPGGCLTFAFMSTPGACAAELRTEVLGATVPRDPDLVCVMAPSNDLTASRTVDEGRASFARFLGSVCTRWPKVWNYFKTVDFKTFDCKRQRLGRGASAVASCVCFTYVLSELMKLWSCTE